MSVLGRKPRQRPPSQARSLGRSNPGKALTELWSPLSAWEMRKRARTAGGTPRSGLGASAFPARAAYLATRGTEGAIGGDGHRVQVARVPDVVSLQFAVGQIPNLERRKRGLNTATAPQIWRYGCGGEDDPTSPSPACPSRRRR